MTVPTIHCAACIDTITAYLRAHEGIEQVAGDARTKRLRVHYRLEAANDIQIRAMIEKLGHEVAA